MGTRAQRIARRSERIHVRLPVALRVESQDQSVEHEAHAANLSNGGVQIFGDFALLPGQAVTIITDEHAHCCIPGRVVWVGPVGSRLEGHAGIEFREPLPNPA